MNQPKICVAGSSNMDLVTSVKRMPLPGETIHGIDFHTFFGGKGANQAIMAAKLGGRVTMIAKVGNDGFGQQYLENYQSSGLVTDYVSVTDEAPTGIAAITVDEQGQNSIIVVSGANFAMTPSDIEKATPAVREADAALCQLEIPLDATIRFLEIAKDANVLTIFNSAPAQELPEKIYALSDYFCPNETEAALMAGFPVKTIEDAEKAGRLFIGRGAKSVIVTMGGLGSLFVSADKVFHVPAEKVKAVDTTGAGDAYRRIIFLASGID